VEFTAVLLGAAVVVTPPRGARNDDWIRLSREVVGMRTLAWVLVTCYVAFAVAGARASATPVSDSIKKSLACYSKSTAYPHLHQKPLPDGFDAKTLDKLAKGSRTPLESHNAMVSTDYQRRVTAIYENNSTWGLVLLSDTPVKGVHPADLSSIATTRGIRVGDSGSMVVARLGQPQRTYATCGQKQITYDNGCESIVFTVSKDVVRKIFWDNGAC
jgi:hypothetical protein